VGPDHSSIHMTSALLERLHRKPGLERSALHGTTGGTRCRISILPTLRRKAGAPFEFSKYKEMALGLRTLKGKAIMTLTLGIEAVDVHYAVGGGKGAARRVDNLQLE